MVTTAKTTKRTTSSRWLYLSVLCLLISGGAAAATAAASSSPQSSNSLSAVKFWLENDPDEDEQGFLHPHLDLIGSKATGTAAEAAAESSRPHSFHVIAKDTIQKGELLLRVHKSDVLIVRDKLPTKKGTDNRFQVDDRIATFVDNEQKWYSGVVEHVNDHLENDAVTYHVQFDDGDEERKHAGHLLVPEIGIDCRWVRDLVESIKEETLSSAVTPEGAVQQQQRRTVSRYSVPRGENSLRRRLPRHWTEFGKSVLSQLLNQQRQQNGNMLPPFHWDGEIIEDDYDDYVKSKEEEENNNENNKEAVSGKKELKTNICPEIVVDKKRNDTAAHSYYLVVPVGWEEVFLPVLFEEKPFPSGNDEDDAEAEDDEERFGWIGLKATQTYQAGETVIPAFPYCSVCGKTAARRRPTAKTTTASSSSSLTSVLSSHYGTAEIFRDYGWVEDFPQRWIFQKGNNNNKGENDGNSTIIAFDLVEEQALENETVAAIMSSRSNDIPATLTIQWLQPVGPEELTLEDRAWMQAQLLRLKDFEETMDAAFSITSSSSINSSNSKPLRPAIFSKLPPSEWNVLKEFHQALVLAFEHAIAAATAAAPESTSAATTGSSSGQVETLVPNFLSTGDSLQKIPEVWSDERPMTCDWHTIFMFDHWDNMEMIQSNYQKISFDYNSHFKDICFDLDHTVQICTSYRPQYHEMAVHYTARFLPLGSIKRALFVGGGDSMLLHEFLKYPEIEKVVGLELDQQVVRGSFKHFGTQPHWDQHNKVEWWFGDATKSLLMLPKDYFGSFDLVVVDLSETVMALTVTGDLDIMGAVNLLVKPDGILVKNEYMYFQKHSRMFEHALHVHFYDVPIVCSQSLILSSEKVDLLRGKRVDHEVEYLLDHLLGEASEVGLPIVRDYQRNETSLNTRCVVIKANEEKEKKESKEQETSPGILMIFEAEKGSLTKFKSGETIVAAVQKAVEEAGLAMVSTIKSSEMNNIDTVVFVLREGYIVARYWTSRKYCAFDIHLWSSFEKHDKIKTALIVNLGSSLSSAYRIVAGGMFGASTWKEDEKNRGPQFTGEKCEEPIVVVREKQPEPKHVMAALEESTAFIVPQQQQQLGGGGNKGVVVVLCGPKDSPCASAEMLHTNPRVAGQVIELNSCPGLAVTSDLSDVSPSLLLSCEKETIEMLSSNLSGNDRIGAIFVDNAAPRLMGQAAMNIFSQSLNAFRFLAHDNLIVAAAVMDERDDEWRRIFVHRFREKIYDNQEPVFTGEVLFNSTESSFELTVMSAGDKSFVDHLVSLAETVEQKTGLVSDIRSIRAGEFSFQDDLVPTHTYMPDHYDQITPLQQWTSQKPLGLQTVFQFENDVLLPTVDKEDLKGVLESTLGRLKNSKPKVLASHITLEEVKTIGEGTVVVALWAGGSLIALWDGRKHLDVNLFTYAENTSFANAYAKTLINNYYPDLRPTLRDEQPRGIGRVVNYVSDLESVQGLPMWAQKFIGDERDEKVVKTGGKSQTALDSEDDEDDDDQEDEYDSDQSDDEKDDEDEYQQLGRSQVAVGTSGETVGI